MDFTRTVTVRINVRAETLKRALELTESPAAEIEDWCMDRLTKDYPWIGVTTRQDGTSEQPPSRIRDMLAFRKRPGFVECPGSYAGDHQPQRPGIEATCQHCGNSVHTISYGKHLRRHFIPKSFGPA
jgi:5-methylcytosine-specific restriction endonuclease McrA